MVGVGGVESLQEAAEKKKKNKNSNALPRLSDSEIGQDLPPWAALWWETLLMFGRVAARLLEAENRELLGVFSTSVLSDDRPCAVPGRTANHRLVSWRSSIAVGGAASR